MTRISRCSTSWQLRTVSPQHLLSIASARHTTTLGCRTRSLPNSISAQNCFLICSRDVKRSLGRTVRTCSLLTACQTGPPLRSAPSSTVFTGQLQISNSHRERRRWRARRSWREPSSQPGITLVLPRWPKTRFFATLWRQEYIGTRVPKNCLSWASSAKLSHASANSMSTTCASHATQSMSKRALSSPSSQDEKMTKTPGEEAFTWDCIPVTKTTTIMWANTFSWQDLLLHSSLVSFYFKRFPFSAHLVIQLFRLL